MKQHTVRTETVVHYFKETNNIFDVKIGGCEVYGQADSITEFVKKLKLEQQWIPYGYVLRIVHRNENSKNMTAFLYRLGQEF